MGKLSEWEKDLLMQDVARIDENPRPVLGVAKFNVYALVVYGIAAAVAVFVFMWGQT